jgi:hypothetical protein
MAELKLPYALDAADRLVSAEVVPRGAACGCRCPECFSPLISKQGEVLRWHFAHEADSDGGTGKGCTNAFETMVHRLAKQIILDAGRITVPAFVAHYGLHIETVRGQREVSYLAAEDEVWLQDIRRRPDALVQAGGKLLAIEIYVAHLCPKEKRDGFAARGLAAIEIDLSRYRMAVPDDFAAIVLSSANRAWLFHPEQADADNALAAKYAEIDRLAAERAARRAAAQAEATRLMRERAAEREAAEAAKWAETVAARARQEEMDRRESERRAQQAAELAAMTEAQRKAAAEQQEQERLEAVRRHAEEMTEIERRRAIVQAEDAARWAAERAEADAKRVVERAEAAARERKRRRQHAELQIAAARSAVLVWERCWQDIEDGPGTLARARANLTETERRYASDA